MLMLTMAVVMAMNNDFINTLPCLNRAQHCLTICLYFPSDTLDRYYIHDILCFQNEENGASYFPINPIR